MSPQTNHPPDADEPTDSVSNVFTLVPRLRPAQAEPLFTDAERAALRAMLRGFTAIKSGCPMARRALQVDE